MWEWARDGCWVESGHAPVGVCELDQVRRGRYASERCRWKEDPLRRPVDGLMQEGALGVVGWGVKHQGELPCQDGWLGLLGARAVGGNLCILPSLGLALSPQSVLPYPVGTCLQQDRRQGRGETRGALALTPLMRLWTNVLNTGLSTASTLSFTVDQSLLVLAAHKDHQGGFQTRPLLRPPPRATTWNGGRVASVVLKALQDSNMPRLRADVGSAGGEPQKAGILAIIRGV